ICSAIRRDPNTAYVLTNGILPVVERPAASPAAFCSAIPTFTCCFGTVFINLVVLQDPPISASTTMMFLFSFPNSAISSPNASRVAFFTTSFVKTAIIEPLLLVVLPLLVCTLLHLELYRASQQHLPYKKRLYL